MGLLLVLCCYIQITSAEMLATCCHGFIEHRDVHWDVFLAVAQNKQRFLFLVLIPSAHVGNGFYGHVVVQFLCLRHCDASFLSA